jgi:phytoene/squalene synthetase
MRPADDFDDEPTLDQTEPKTRLWWRPARLTVPDDGPADDVLDLPDFVPTRNVKGGV